MTEHQPHLSLGCALVMKDAEPFLAEQLQSILDQSMRLDRLVIIDDGSQDRSAAIASEVLSVASFDWTIEPARPPRKPVNTFHRIAANFQLGVELVDTDVVLLSDHDDRWLPDRVAIQTAAFIADPGVAMVAHDADLMDERSVPVAGSLRERFPVPPDWSRRDDSWRSAYLLHHSLATGAASAIAPQRLGDLAVPAGWLHDAWWALTAVTRGALLLAPKKVISYRVHEAQAIGVTDQRLRDSQRLRWRKRLDETRLGLRHQGWRSPLIYPRSAVLKRTR